MSNKRYQRGLEQSKTIIPLFIVILLVGCGDASESKTTVSAATPNAGSPALPTKTNGETTVIGGQLPGISISFVGFTNSGPARVMSGSMAPATNQTIFGPRSSSLSGPTNFTTRVPGGAAALFRYTNSSPYVTICVVQSMEYETESGWQGVPVPVVVGGNLAIYPNSTDIQMLPVNATNVAWRIKVFCVEQATGLRRKIDRGEEYVRKQLTGEITEKFSGRKYLVSGRTGSAQVQPDADGVQATSPVTEPDLPSNEAR